MRVIEKQLSLGILAVSLVWLAAACAGGGPEGVTAATSAEPPASPGPAPAEPLQPYPYTTPLPPPTPTILDGVYQRALPVKGTPVPCRRCAPYRAEGGTWTLQLTAGAFGVSHDITPFRGVGSFTVSGEQITFFNDPNCMQDSGIYRWRRDGRSLLLEEVADPCAFGLRARNLTAGRWVAVELQGQQVDPDQ